MEAERLNAEAKARHDEIIDQARRQAEAAQERARALEQRRQELITELETLRSTLSRMEGELDERRTRLGLSAANEAIEDERSSVRVVRADEAAERQDWELGETVRVVPARRREAAVEPEELVAEVRRLRGDTPPPTAAPSPSPAEPEPEASPPPPEEEPPPAEPEPAPPPPDLPAPAPVESPPPDEVADIFRRLRGEEPGPVAIPPPLEVPHPAVTPAAALPVEETPAPAASPTRVLTMADPFELRDRLLLPVTNRALRNLKRQLTELQNLALEELRVSGGSWRPPDDGFVEELRPDLVVLTAEAFSMGHTAAEELAGQTMARPATPTRNEAADLARQLVDQLQGVMEGEESGRELSSAVSRVFRVWRTDEAERKVSDLAAVAFHQGLQGTLQRAGWGHRFVLSGRGCVRCREAAEAEEGVLPPLHPGCGCTVVPVPG
jgi:hypothetical protein